MSQSESDGEEPQASSSVTPNEKDHISTKKKPTTINMLNEAIKELCVVEKKGATIQGMKRIIMSKYPETQENRLKHDMKVALKKGLDSGQFVRPKNSEDKTGIMTGRYKLGKLPKPKSVKAADKVKAKKKKESKKKKVEEKEGDTEEEEEGGTADEDTEKTPTKRRPLKKTNTNKAARRAHSLSPKVKKSKSKVRRSISLTPGKAMPKAAKKTKVAKKEEKEETTKKAAPKTKAPKKEAKPKEEKKKAAKGKENANPEEEPVKKKTKAAGATKTKKKAAAK